MPDLPPFPVDAETFDLIETAMTTPDGHGRFSWLGVLDMLAGIDPADSSQVEYVGTVNGLFGEAPLFHDHRVHYTPESVVLALIAEVRRLRHQEEEGT